MQIDIRPKVTHNIVCLEHLKVNWKIRRACPHLVMELWNCGIAGLFIAEWRRDRVRLAYGVDEILYRIHIEIYYII